MKNILIFALLLIVGCTNTHTQLPIKKTLEPFCLKGDKEALWDSYTYYNNQMIELRRHYTKHCVWERKSHYDQYCSNLRKLHTRTENYVDMLHKRYKETCTTRKYN